MVSKTKPIEVDLTTSNDSDPGNEDDSSNESDPRDETEEDVSMPDLEDILIIDGRQRPTDQDISIWKEKSTYKDTESPEGMLEVMDYYTTAKTEAWWMETPEVERAQNGPHSGTKSKN